ncbi:MAG: hypothetical protein ACYC9Y_00105 [Candidatus Methylomirabilia bacterium]
MLKSCLNAADGRNESPGAAGSVRWREFAAVGAVLLLLGIAFTWPLTRHFTTDVLYTHQAQPGYERVPIAQGDHLQLLYFFWLFGDSVREGRVPLTDHYEFRDGSPAAFFFQPSLLPLLTFLLSPLGLIASYNLLTLLSFVGAGLATHLLLRLEIEDRWAAFAGALVVALFPYRVAQLAGHAFGFLSFLIPLYLYFFERSLRATRPAGWVVAAGATFFFAGAMEFHIIYYLTLLLGVYLPFRFVSPLSGWFQVREPALAVRADRAAPVLALLGGAGAGSAAYFAADSVHHFGNAAGWVVTPAVCSILALLAWSGLSRAAARYLPPPGAGLRRVFALPFAPLALLLLTPFGARLGIPYLGRAAATVALVGAAALCLPLVRLLAQARLLPQARGLFMSRARCFLLHGGFVCATLGYLVVVRKLIFKDSIAGSGRRFSDVTAYSPHPIDLVSVVNTGAERMAYVGVVAAALALVGLAVVLRVADPGRRARLAFFAGLGVGGLVLAVGPNLDLFPVYHLFFRIVPMFNFPRVSGRILAVGVVGLAMLAALGLAALRQRAGRLAAVLTAVVLVLLVADYLPARAPGLTTLPLAHPVYDRLARERAPGETILELPVWPGDSAWTSDYLWYVTRYRNLLINGYSPATPRNYVERVFTPLYPLDFGEMRRPQYDLLRRLGIRFIVFHEEVYPSKISDFPFRVAVENLRASKYLETVTGAPPLWLFRLKSEPPAGEEFVAGVGSPVGSLREAEHWNAGRGIRVEDPLASGGAAILFPAGAAGRLGRPVPARDYPSGNYRVQARFLADPSVAAPGLELEVRQAETGELITSTVVPAGSGRDGVLDLEADFTLKSLERITTQVASDGSAPVRWDYVLVRFAGAPEPPLSIQIEDLWHAGVPLADPEASGGQAVELIPGYNPRDFAFSGPDRVLQAGAWVARLRFGAAAPAGPTGGERFEVTVSNVEKSLAAVSLPLSAGPGGYREVALPFSLTRPTPVRFRVYFPGERRLVLDRISVVPD